MTTTKAFDTTTTAKQSTWSAPKSRPWALKVFLEQKWLRWFFCVDSAMLEAIERECEIRDEVRHELTIHRRGAGRQAILCCVDDVYQDLGYDLTRLERDAALVQLEREEERMAAEAEAVLAMYEGAALQAQEERRHREADQTARELHNEAVAIVNDLMDIGAIPVDEAFRVEQPHSPMLALAPSEDQEAERKLICQARAIVETGEYQPIAPTVITMPQPVVEEERTALVIPRFVASLVTMLRVKFGKLANSEANRLLIEREYLKVCRETDIRNTDIATHQQWVLNTYFNEGVMEQLAMTRVRLPAWLRAAFGAPPNAAPAVC